MYAPVAPHGIRRMAKTTAYGRHKQLTTPLIYDRRSAKRQTFYEVASGLPFIFVAAATRFEMVGPRFGWEPEETVESGG